MLPLNNAAGRRHNRSTNLFLFSCLLAARPFSVSPFVLLYSLGMCCCIPIHWLPNHLDKPKEPARTPARPPPKDQLGSSHETTKKQLLLLSSKTVSELESQHLDLKKLLMSLCIYHLPNGRGTNILFIRT
jgi:hypothetical protein